jgi:hypothetical protein
MSNTTSPTAPPTAPPAVAAATATILVVLLVLCVTCGAICSAYLKRQPRVLRVEPVGDSPLHTRHLRRGVTTFA